MSTKSLIEYYNKQNISIKKWLKGDINDNNDKALFYIEYAVENVLNIKGIKELLNNIAQIEKSGTDGERLYHNSIMEFHAIYFVHSMLRLKLIEVNSANNPVLSPNRSGKKSCDIRARNVSQEYFFESKDASSEITTSSAPNAKGLREFDPMLEEKVKKWIIKKSKISDSKGANYLICRVPVWRPEDEFYNKWINKMFKIEKKISKNNFVITLPVKLSSNFEGVYIIKSYGYLKLQIKP